AMRRGGTRASRCLFTTSITASLFETGLAATRGPHHHHRVEIRRAGCYRRQTCGTRPAEIVSGVCDPVMMYAHQHFYKTVGDKRELANRDVALVKLSVVADPHDDRVDHVSQLWRRRIGHGSSGRLNRVGDHYYRRLLALRLRTRVAKLLLEHRRVRIFRFPSRLVVKVLHQPRPMMFGDY